MIDRKFVIDSGKECIQHCPFENIRPKIELTGDAVLKLRYLQEKFKDLDVEFLVYGNATRKTDDINFNYVLDDVVVPEQKVAMASVDDVVTVGNFNTVIHKHPGDSVGFSGTDEEFVNSNHDFSIVIGNDNKLKHSNGIAYVQIDCGRYMKAKLDVDVTIPSSKDEEFINSTKNIKVVIDGRNFLTKIFGGGTKQDICRRCKQPLEKIGNELHCTKCQIIYVQS